MTTTCRPPCGKSLYLDTTSEVESGGRRRRFYCSAGHDVWVPGEAPAERAVSVAEMRTPGPPSHKMPDLRCQRCEGPIEPGRYATFCIPCSPLASREKSRARHERKRTTKPPVPGCGYCRRAKRACARHDGRRQRATA